MDDRRYDPLVKIGIAIQLLGGFYISINQETIPEARWKSRRARSLVKLLALTPGHRLHRDQVIDTLWPDSDLAAAANNFHQTLYAARRVLDPLAPGCLPLVEGQLSLLDGVVDVDGFEAAATQACDSQDTPVYQAALEFYKGDLLPDDLYEEWTIQRRESLRQTYLRLLLEMAGLHEACQEYAPGIEALQRLLEVDKSHEEAHAGLMRLYALSGQRQHALRQFQALREALRAELDAEPSPGTLRLYEDIQSGHLAQTAAPNLAGASARRHNLQAQLTSFIGREKEIVELNQKVIDQRLVTLTGSGGTGKTRLALQVACGVLDAFPDGVFLVELAPLSDPALVMQACLQSLELVQQPGIPPQTTLAHYLEKKHILLILDNCEHMIGACASLVSTLLKDCPQLHILVASREILSIPGENPFRVPSLAFPDLRNLPPLEELSQYEAIRLFVERSEQTRSGFTLITENAQAVAQICQRLDGIPLAIELAAARTRLMTAEQIASRLDNTFRLLTGGSKTMLPRQQTLKATIDWSYDLLAPKERLLLQRLSVFAGGWSLEAVEEVCPDEEGTANYGEGSLTSLEVMDLLAQLVDKSLVIASLHKGGGRYHLLETIRQYARDRLMETGRGIEVRDSHLVYFANLSGEAEPHLRGKGQIEWCERLDQELDNLRAALEWSFSSRIELGLKIAADLMWFWHLRELFQEAFEWLEKLLGAEIEQRGKQPLAGECALQRARGLRALAYQGNYFNIQTLTERVAIYQESIAILRALESFPRRELGISLLFLLLHQGILDQPSPIREEMLDILQKENEKFYLSEYLFVMVSFAEDWDQAIDIENTSLAISREIEDLDGICSRSAALGYLMMIKGDYLKAEALFMEAIEISRKVKNHWIEAALFDALSGLAMVQGKYEEAINHSEAAILRYRELNYLTQIDGPLQTLQQIAWSQGNYGESIRFAQENFASYARPFTEIGAYLYLGRVAISQNDLPQAEGYMKRAIPSGIWKEYTFRWVVLTPYLLGWIALFRKQGKYPDCAGLMGTVDSIYRQIAPGLVPRERSEYEEDRALTRSALGEDAFAEAFDEGQAMTLEQAITWVAEEMHVSRD